MNHSAAMAGAYLLVTDDARLPASRCGNATTNQGGLERAPSSDPQIESPKPEILAPFGLVSEHFLSQDRRAEPTQPSSGRTGALPSAKVETRELRTQLRAVSAALEPEETLVTSRPLKRSAWIPHRNQGTVWIRDSNPTGSHISRKSIGLAIEVDMSGCCHAQVHQNIRSSRRSTAKPSC